MRRSKLIGAMQTKDARTHNNAVTHSTSGSAVVDLFFTIGALRQRSEEEIKKLFYKAWDENPLDALKVLFWARDIRKGQGERRTFQVIIRDLAFNRTREFLPNLMLVPFFGYWKDMLHLFGTPLESEALDLIGSALREKDGLACKWMPREKSANAVNRAIATKIRRHLGLSPKQYRKLLVEGTKVVETQMCAGNWDGITYEHVPSRAMMIYRKAFGRHSPEKFADFIQAVQSGTKKIKAGTLYPHDIVGKFIVSSGYGYSASFTNLGHGDMTVLNEQWKALPDYIKGSAKAILPIVDVSGSMIGMKNGTTVMPLIASIALGMYVSERSEGMFKNHFLTFSTKPSLVKVTGRNIQEKIRNMAKADWAGSTNIQAAFDLILDHAVANNVPVEDMPEVITLFTDMEFNSSGVRGKTNFEVIAQKYRRAGYEMPQLVFWNLNAREGNSPVKFNEQGVALVSGFSPSTMEAILGGVYTPQAMMRSVIDSERYSAVSIG